MATKYPTALDDATTLGPTFLDVTPPADPQRNIAAEFRNNSNEAVLAVQTRLGILDDTSTASVDWGLLTVSSTPNQGLRFAGSHATFPGLQAEDGIFLDSASGNPAFHKAGDPVGTFTDLTSGGGVSDWDALYGASKTMDISGTALTWTQSAGTGIGFLVQKTSNTATDAVMKVQATGTGFPADTPVLSVLNSRFASPGLALDLSGYLRFSQHGRIYTEGGTDLEIETTGANAPLTINTTSSAATSPITIDAGISDLTLTTGNTAKIYLQGASGYGVDISGCPLTMTLESATWSLGGVLCQITHPGNTTNGFRLNMQGADNLNWNDGNANRIWASDSHLTIETTRSLSDLHLQSNQDAYLNATRDVIFAARGSANISLNDAGNPIPTTTNKTIVGAINELAAGGGGNNLDEAYNAFGGAGTVSVDAGNLTWQVPSSATFYDIIWQDDSANVFLQIDSSADELILGSANKNVSMAGDITSPVKIDATTGLVAFEIDFAPIVAGASIVDFGTAVSSRWNLKETGKVSAAYLTPVSNFVCYDSQITSNGIAGGGSLSVLPTAGIATFQSQITGSTSDTGFAFMCGFKADYTSPGGGSQLSVGFWADENHGLGLLSQSPVSIRVDSALNTPALHIRQNGSGDILQGIDGNGPTTRLSLAKDGVLKVTTDGDSATDPCVYLDQDRSNGPFFVFDGLEASDYDAPISTKNGDGAIVGPQDKSSQDGWDFADKLLKVRIGAAEYWLALYVPDTTS